MTTTLSGRIRPRNCRGGCPPTWADGHVGGGGEFDAANAWATEIENEVNLLRHEDANAYAKDLELLIPRQPTRASSTPQGTCVYPGKAPKQGSRPLSRNTPAQST